MAKQAVCDEVIVSQKLIITMREKRSRHDIEKLILRCDRKMTILRNIIVSHEFEKFRR